MHETLELFPTAEYLDTSHRARKKKPKNDEAQLRELAESLFADWELQGIDTRDMLLELKFREIKTVLIACNPRQQQAFAIRLTEWVFSDAEA